MAGIHALYSWDHDAVRRYCGAYVLLRRAADGALCRCDGPIPDGYEPIADSTDEDGFLLPRFWSLPRL
jgi:hypothetical protein